MKKLAILLSAGFLALAGAFAQAQTKKGGAAAPPFLPDDLSQKACRLSRSCINAR